MTTPFAPCQAGRMGFRHAWDPDIPICYRPNTAKIVVDGMRNDRCFHCELVRAVMWDAACEEYVMRYDTTNTGITYRVGDSRPTPKMTQAWLAEKVRREHQARRKAAAKKKTAASRRLAA